MLGQAHMAAGLICAEFAVVHSAPESLIQTAGITAFAVLGSLIPDIDSPRSLLSASSKAVSDVSTCVRAVTRHRGFTHTPIFIALLSLLIARLPGLDTNFSCSLALAFALGGASHLLLDSLTKSGVMLLWPLSPKHIRFARFTTGSFAERIVTILLSAIAAGGVIAAATKFF